MADYCVYWFRKAHDHLPPCTPEDPLAGRAGLVGTQNIRNNQSRVGGLDHVVKTGTIVEAVDTQPWSGEANVHVSIANWVKTRDEGLLPKSRHLWAKSATRPSKASRNGQRADKVYQLIERECAEISSSLSDATHTATATRLACNFEPQVCFNGQFPRSKGFEIENEEAARLIAANARNSAV